MPLPGASATVKLTVSPSASLASTAPAMTPLPVGAFRSIVATGVVLAPVTATTTSMMLIPPRPSETAKVKLSVWSAAVAESAAAV